MKLRVGCHLSSAGGFLKMGKTAASIGANTFQFFTRNPRGSRAKALDPEDIRGVSGVCGRTGYPADSGPRALHFKRRFRGRPCPGVCQGDYGR